MANSRFPTSNEEKPKESISDEEKKEKMALLTHHMEANERKLKDIFEKLNSEQLEKMMYSKPEKTKQETAETEIMKNVLAQYDNINQADSFKTKLALTKILYGYIRDHKKMDLEEVEAICKKQVDLMEEWYYLKKPDKKPVLSIANTIFTSRLPIRSMFKEPNAQKTPRTPRVSSTNQKPLEKERSKRQLKK